MLTRILEGNVVRLQAEFEDHTGATVTPDSVTFYLSLRGSSDAPVPLTPTADEDGVWTVDFKPDAPGAWSVRAEATNPDAAAEDTVIVDSSSFPAA